MISVPALGLPTITALVATITSALTPVARQAPTGDPNGADQKYDNVRLTPARPPTSIG